MGPRHPGPPRADRAAPQRPRRSDRRAGGPLEHPRARAGAGGGAASGSERQKQARLKLTLANRVLAALLHRRLALPYPLLARLPGVNRNTVSRAIRRTGPL